MRLIFLILRKSPLCRKTLSVEGSVVWKGSKCETASSVEGYLVWKRPYCGNNILVQKEHPSIQGWARGRLHMVRVECG